MCCSRYSTADKYKGNYLQFFVNFDKELRIKICGVIRSILKLRIQFSLVIRSLLTANKYIHGVDVRK